MTSERRTEANGRNCLGSTGPRTEQGKQKSRRNALKHGLTAETVIDGLEDAEEYRQLETQLLADYLPRSTVERELVFRLASLMWGLRRATAIETRLLQIHADILRHLKEPREVEAALYRGDSRMKCSPSDPAANQQQDRHRAYSSRTNELPDILSVRTAPSTPFPQRMSIDIARCFLRLSNVGNGLFDRLGRYEGALWRQVAQTLFALDDVKRHHRVAGRWRDGE